MVPEDGASRDRAGNRCPSKTQRRPIVTRRDVLTEDEPLAGPVACVLRSIRLMRKPSHDHTDQPALQREPDEWKTGDEPMTDAQRSYLETLSRETGEPVDDTLSKADASKRIDELRGRSPRLAGK